MGKLDHRCDERFHQQGISSPLFFLCLFILFVYGSLVLGLAECANWLIHTKNLVFLSALGLFGTAIVVACFIFAWVAIVAIIAFIPYAILRKQGRVILADKVRLIVTLFLFHIFATPWILWPMIRNGSPRLRRAYRQKLKKMALSNKMKERLEERHRRLSSKVA